MELFYFKNKQTNPHYLQMLKKLKKEKDVEWEQCPDWYKWGTVVKKQAHLVQGHTPKGKAVVATRRRVVALSVDFGSGISHANVHFLLCKALPLADSEDQQHHGEIIIMEENQNNDINDNVEEKSTISP